MALVSVLSPTTGQLPTESQVGSSAPFQTTKDDSLLSNNDPLAKYPGKLSSELCWDQGSLGGSEPSSVIHLTPTEVNNIKEAVAYFKSLKLSDVALISTQNFPLPAGLVTKLRRVSNTLHNERGFAVIRGLDAKTQSDEDSVIAFVGIANCIGGERQANSNGMAMDHLRDAIRDPKPAGREHVDLHPSKMMAPLKFHADRNFADILALYVKSKAASGGEQYLASAWTVYNMMLESYPDELRVLAQDFPWPGVKNGQPHTTFAPVFFQKNGRVLCQVVYRVFEESKHLLTDAQWRALDIFEKCAKESAIQLDDVRAGDIQLANNLAILHARSGWIDRPGRERHYYRLGLRDPEHMWARPDSYEDEFNSRFDEFSQEEQTIPIKDFDPYGLTSLEGAGHG